MLKLSNMTIRDKLISIIMLVSLSALALTGFILLGYVHITFRNSMVQDMLTDADMTADNCNVALAFRNVEDVEKTLASLKSKSSVVFGGVYTTSGENFANYYRGDADSSVQPLALRKDGYYLGNGFLTVFKSIVLDNEKIGTLCIRSDLNPLYVIFKNSITVISVALILALSMAYFLSAKLQKIISVSILKLAEVARLVSEKKDYSTRAQKQSNDEVGLLIDAFNEMLEQIQQRDSALLDTNVQLTNEVTERKKAEKALEKLNKDLESTIQELSRSNRELQEFAHIAAHDLKSPLRAIGTLTDWLATDYSDKFDQRGKKRVDLIVSRAKRIDKIVDSILQYSEIRRIRQKEQKVDLNVVLSEVIREIEPSRNIEITVENKLPTIICAKRQVAMIFENLLSNAIRYMDKPKGQIKVGCCEEGGFWKFSVSDNGPGVEQKYFEKIFKIFQTLSTRDEVETIGIGLSLTKKIVELYGGRIWVQSEPGQGCTFYFTLPRQEIGIKDAEFKAYIVS